MTDNMDFITEEGIGYLPSSWASTHETNNSFRARSSKVLDVFTPRYLSFPIKPSVLNHSMFETTEMLEKV